jgi:hypothetical protein
VYAVGIQLPRNRQQQDAQAAAEGKSTRMGPCLHYVQQLRKAEREHVYAPRMQHKQNQNNKFTLFSDFELQREI